jgi:hypothetical protein
MVNILPGTSQRRTDRLENVEQMVNIFPAPAEGGQVG